MQFKQSKRHGTPSLFFNRRHRTSIWDGNRRSRQAWEETLDQIVYAFFLQQNMMSEPVFMILKWFEDMNQ